MSVLKYQDVQQSIRERIDSGVYQPGMKLPSQRKLMAEFAVSYATVTSALDQLQADGLIDRQERRGIFVSEHRPLKVKRVGVFMSESRGLNSPGHTKGVFDRIKELGIELEIIVFEGEAQRRMHAASVINKELKVDACLIPHYAGYSDIISVFNEHNFPYAVIDVPHHDDGFNYILADNEAASYDVTQHLILHGNKEIALVGTKRGSLMKGSNWPHAKIDGYKRALAESDIAFNEDLIFESNGDRDELRDIAQKIIDKKLRACFFAHGKLAQHVVDYFIEKGLRVPRDMAWAYVATHEVPELDVAPYFATGVTFNRQLAGKLAVDAVVAGVEQGEMNSPVLVPYELIKRRSCGCVE